MTTKGSKEINSSMFVSLLVLIGWISLIAKVV